MQPPTVSQTELLTQQGMVALQANDKARAYDLLSRAIQLEPHNEQAWLWLSGAVESTAERRYCLEQVLVINPHSAAAQRGMALLPPALPVSPFQKELLPEPAPPQPAAPEPTPVATPAAALGFVAMASVPNTQPNSLLDIIAMPDTSSEAHASKSADPAVVTYMPPPISAAAETPAAHVQNQALADFIVREFGRHRSRDEIVRALSEEHRMAWGEAEALVARVANERHRSIAARQSPFLIFLGIATIIGGCILVGRGIFVLSLLRSDPTLLRSMNPRAMGITIAQMGLGVVMVLGALLGLGQTIKGLFK